MLGPSLRMRKKLEYPPRLWSGRLGLSVGFLLLRYSVECNVESLSLLYLIFIS